MPPFAVFLFSVFILLQRVSSELNEDQKTALLSFINSVKHHHSYNWTDYLEFPCTTPWKGVICDPTSNTTVIYLRLPAASLSGNIPPNTIGKLSSLRVLSLHTNNLSGTIPSDFSNLTLTHLYLHNNRLSGFLPDIKAKDLKRLDVSNNSLNCSIPESLSHFQKFVFLGNKNLCGDPLSPCNGTREGCPRPYEQPKAHKHSKKERVTVGVSVGSGLLLIFLLFCLRKEIFRLRKSSLEAPAVATLLEGEGYKLVLLDCGIDSFEVDDLFGASAECLGRGSVGTSYKRVLEKEKMKMKVVLKRLKDVEVTKAEFESHMEVFGRMKNENVVPLKGYIYSEDEKWLVYDYMPAGSLSAYLHGSGTVSTGTRPNWKHRMRIALDVAMGVAHLHASNVVHGNIKSTNILLEQEINKDPTVSVSVSVSDYGLHMLFARTSSPNHWAPEIVNTPNFSFRSDVYSFGVLLLELLTSRSPMGEMHTDFPMWVQSVVHEEPHVKIFDVELCQDIQNVKEMFQMLRIAKDCVSIEPHRRPTMKEVVSMMEEMPLVETITT